MKVLARLFSISTSQMALIARLFVLMVLAFAFKPVANEIGYGTAILLLAVISPALLIVGNKD